MTRIVQTFRKGSGEVLDYGLNYDPASEPYLESGETIISSSWDVPSGITNVADSFDDTTTTIWLSGGTVGETYVLTNTVVTASGYARTVERSIAIKVEDR